MSDPRAVPPAGDTVAEHVLDAERVQAIRAIAPRRGLSGYRDRNLSESIASLCDDWLRLRAALAEARAQVAALTAERDALTADKARLDWLAEQASKRGPVESYGVESPPLVAAIAFDSAHTLREAIDAARASVVAPSAADPETTP